jgi:hypothetical protein
VFENVADKECRQLVVFQIRKTGDSIFPVPKIESKFLFVFIAKTSPKDRQNSLAGTAFIVRKKNWPPVKEKIAVFQQCLRTAQQEITLGNMSLLSSTVEAPAAEAVKYLTSAAVFKATVRISRSGTTDIKYDPTDSPPIPPYFPENEIQQDRMIKAISAQIFFFLKDIGHHHQHHHKTTDTITDIYPLTANDPDVEWRSSTLYSIYRKVIEFKRSPDKNTFNDCLGLLAYADAFKKISIRELKPEQQSELPEYYSEEISKSVAATQSKWESQTEDKRYREDTRRNIFIAVFGAIIAYIGLMQFGQNKVEVQSVSPILIKILNILLADPVKCFVAFIFFSYIDVIGRLRSAAEPESVFLRLFVILPKQLTLLLIAMIFLVGLCFLCFELKHFF